MNAAALTTYPLVNAAAMDTYPLVNTTVLPLLVGSLQMGAIFRKMYYREHCNSGRGNELPKILAPCQTKQPPSPSTLGSRDEQGGPKARRWRIVVIGHTALSHRVVGGIADYNASVPPPVGVGSSRPSRLGRVP